MRIMAGILALCLAGDLNDARGQDQTQSTRVRSRESSQRPQQNPGTGNPEDSTRPEQAPNQSDEADSKSTELKIFRLKNAVAVQTVGTVQQVTGIRQMTAEPVSNTVIATGTPEQLERLEAILQYLDEVSAPLQLQVELVAVHLIGDDPLPSEEVTLRQAHERPARVIRLRSVENLPATFQLGSSEQGVIGETAAAGFRGQGNALRRSRTHGTSVSVTARSNAEKWYLLELTFESSEPKDDSSAVLETTSFRTTIAAVDGRPAVWAEYVSLQQEHPQRTVLVGTVTAVQP